MPAEMVPMGMPQRATPEGVVALPAALVPEVQLLDLQLVPELPRMVVPEETVWLAEPTETLEIHTVAVEAEAIRIPLQTGLAAVVPMDSFWSPMFPALFLRRMAIMPYLQGLHRSRLNVGAAAVAAVLSLPMDAEAVVAVVGRMPAVSSRLFH
jgi:hypothetical protein